MAKKTGLGKGLDALFSNNLIEEVEEKLDKIEEKGQKIEQLKIIDIEPNRNQPRRVFDEESIEELAESVKEYGLLQPIIVSKKDKYYEIVAGERRWRACKKAGMTEIPVIIRDDNERRNKEISLIENIQREDLNPIEKALGIKSLMEEYGLTQQEVSEVLGKARSSIANSVRILNLDERVIQLTLEGKLTEGHCKSLLSIQDKDKQYAMAKYIIESGDSVRDAENKLSRNKTKTNKDRKYEPIYRDIESSFQSFFGSKVRLDAGKRKGKIVIEYASNDDLERILELIKK